jgi:hypothetical protein
MGLLPVVEAVCCGDYNFNTGQTHLVIRESRESVYYGLPRERFSPLKVERTLSGKTAFRLWTTHSGRMSKCVWVTVHLALDISLPKSSLKGTRPAREGSPNL